MTMPCDSFCSLAFVHAHVTASYNRTLCCFADVFDVDTTNMTLTDFWNSNVMNEVRKKMMSGEPIPQCNKCYRDEQSNIGSSRQHFNKKFPKENFIHHVNFDGSINTSPTFFDYRTPLCNLKCISCSPDVSSANSLVYSKLNPNWKPTINIDYLREESYGDEIMNAIMNKTCESIYWAGGEPFMSPAHWRVFDALNELVELDEFSDYIKSIDIYYSTNLTKLTWKNTIIPVALSKYNVSIFASIDGTGDTFDYTRDGARWDDVKHNFIQYYDNLNHKSQLAITTVLSAPVIFDIKSYLDFFKNYNVKFSPNRLETAPGNLLDIRSFPLEIAEPAILYAIELLNGFSEQRTGIDRVIGILSSYLEEKKSNTAFDDMTLLHQSKNFLTARDQHLTNSSSYGDLLKLLNTDAYNWYNSI